MFDKRILLVCAASYVKRQVARALCPLGIVVEETQINDIPAIMDHIAADCILVDLETPGVNGPAAVRTILRNHPQTPIAVMASNPTIASAALAMDAGAADFIQKPFTAAGLRERISRVLIRAETRNDYYQPDYRALIELAQQQIADRRYLDAKAILHAAIADQPREPEAYHLIGVIHEIQGEWIKARNFYRTALDIAPDYTPAKEHLEKKFWIH